MRSISLAMPSKPIAKITSDTSTSTSVKPRVARDVVLQIAFEDGHGLLRTRQRGARLLKIRALRCGHASGEIHFNSDAQRPRHARVAYSERERAAARCRSS